MSGAGGPSVAAAGSGAGPSLRLQSKQLLQTKDLFDSLNLIAGAYDAWARAVRVHPPTDRLSGIVSAGALDLVPAHIVIADARRLLNLERLVLPLPKTA